MTENEAKAVRFIENIKNHAIVTLDHITKEEPNVSTLVYKGREKKADTILAMVEELQQYRKIEREIKEHYQANVDIKMIMKYFIETIFKGEKHERFCILTNEDADKWDEYKKIGTPEECRTSIEKQNVNKKLESHYEKHILECCISLMQEVVNEFAEWYRWQHGEDAIEELDEEERFCFRKSYFRIVQELFLLGTNHSGGTSTRAKCEQLGVDSAEEIEFDWSDEE